MGQHAFLAARAHGYQATVLVQLLQVVGGHGVNAVVLRAVNVVLVTENAIDSQNLR